MPNLRIIYDNKADGATLSASSTAGSCVVDNLKKDTKAKVWRSVGITDETLTAVFGSPTTIGGVILPFCNLSPTATLRVRCYSDAAMTTQVYDSGVVSARTIQRNLRGFTATEAASAYAYGGGSYASHWLSRLSVHALTVNIQDPSNLQGYIEIGRLVIGDYWTPEYNPEHGAPITAYDTSKHFRTDAGNLVTDIGTRFRKQSLNLVAFSATDRDKLWEILLGNGMAYPVLLSVYPENVDLNLEQMYQLHCKLVNTPAINNPAYRQYVTTLELEEV